MTATATKEALLLGMVFAEELIPKRGQEYRDRIRCEALEKLGYTVKTLDNKHKEWSGGRHSGKHCQANFADARRMMRAIKSKWGEETRFSDVILDYFFSPVGWARERWTDNLFIKTFPMLATEGLLQENGKIILPYLDCIEESINDFREYLDPFYTISFQDDPNDNVLYRATDDCEMDLKKTPDHLINETQMAPLLDFSETPFVVLTKRNVFISNNKDDKSSPKQSLKKRSIMSAIESEPLSPNLKVQKVN